MRNPENDTDMRLERLLGREVLDLDSKAIARGLTGRRILVTGAGGSLGTALAEFLIAVEGTDLVLLDNHEPSLCRLRARLQDRSPRTSCRFTLGDVRDDRRIASLLRSHQTDLVFHLAAYKHVPIAEENVDQFVSVNILGTRSIIEQSARTGVRTIVYPSTDKAVNPPSVYGVTKRIVELMAQQWRNEKESPSIHLVRLVNVLGAQGGVIEILSRQIASNIPMTLTHPEMTRYWITMNEATLFLGHAACADEAQGPMLLDLGPPIRLESVARRLANQVRPGAPVGVRYIGMRPGERLHEELCYPHEEVCHTPHRCILEARDRRNPPPGIDVHEIDSLADDIYLLSPDELRQRLFALSGTACS